MFQRGIFPSQEWAWPATNSALPKVKSPPPTAQSQEHQRIALTTLSLPYLRELVAKAGNALNPKEHADLSASLETFTWLLTLVADKNLTLTRLRRALFGNGSESIEHVLASLGSQEPPLTGKSEPEDDLTPAPESTGPMDVSTYETPAPDGQSHESKGNPPTGAPALQLKGNPKGKGHGRTAADKYTGAKRCSVPHGSLSRGDVCPECGLGKVYPLAVPAILVRIEGIGPLVGTVYELHRLRCSSCGRVFTARPPEGVGVEKYDSSVTALVGLLRYGCGLPFHRLSRLQAALGIPLPSSTAFELVEAGADSLETLYEALMWEAAQGQTLHNDDTWIRILKPPEPLDPDDGRDRSERTGLFTTGILSEVLGKRVALYFTGRQHAGENIKEVLLRRKPPTTYTPKQARRLTGVGA